MPDFDRAEIKEYIAYARRPAGSYLEEEQGRKLAACLAEIDRLTEDAKRLRDHLAGVTNGGVAYGLECDYEQSLAQTERLLGEVGADGFRHGWSVARADYQNGEAEGYRRGVEEAAEVARCQWQEELNTKNADKASAWASCAEYIEEHILALIDTPAGEAR